MRSARPFKKLPHADKVRDRALEILRGNDLATFSRQSLDELRNDGGFGLTNAVRVALCRARDQICAPSDLHFSIDDFTKCEREVRLALRDQD